MFGLGPKKPTDEKRGIAPSTNVKSYGGLSSGSSTSPASYGMSAGSLSSAPESKPTKPVARSTDTVGGFIGWLGGKSKDVATTATVFGKQPKTSITKDAGKGYGT